MASAAWRSDQMWVENIPFNKHLLEEILLDFEVLKIFSKNFHILLFCVCLFTFKSIFLFVGGLGLVSAIAQ